MDAPKWCAQIIVFHTDESKSSHIFNKNYIFHERYKNYNCDALAMFAWGVSQGKVRLE